MINMCDTQKTVFGAAGPLRTLLDYVASEFAKTGKNHVSDHEERWN
jgi:hypothetical protein